MGGGGGGGGPAVGAGRQKRQKVLALQICQVQAAQQRGQLGPLPRPSPQSALFVCLHSITFEPFGSALDCATTLAALS